MDTGQVTLLLRRQGGQILKIHAAITDDALYIPTDVEIAKGDIFELEIAKGSIRYLRVDAIRQHDSGSELSSWEVTYTIISRPRRQQHKPSARKPRIFIGSSREGLDIAEYIQLGLQYVADCVVWNQEALSLSELILEGLVRSAHDYDFAVLVLTADDVVIKRGIRGNTARDNVMFELGLFIGALGRSRTFVVCRRDEQLQLPSDLAGLIPATFEPQANMAAALGPVCRQLKTAMHI